LEMRNIKSPAGWLRAALINDYRGEEKEIIPNVIAGSCISERAKPVNTPEWTSNKEALKAIKLIRKNISACISPIPSRKRAKAREDIN